MQQENNKNVFIKCLSVNKNDIKKIKSQSVREKDEKNNKSNHKYTNLKKISENKANNFRIFKNTKIKYRLKPFEKNILNKNYSQGEIKIN